MRRWMIIVVSFLLNVGLSFWTRGNTELEDAKIGETLAPGRPFSTVILCNMGGEDKFHNFNIVIRIKVLFKK